ncbi:MAG: hypothetical protein M5U32_13665 [Myxococcota bacterium]|nr:hypothetical protein [Myxococcota bacterium]
MWFTRLLAALLLPSLLMTAPAWAQSRDDDPALALALAVAKADSEPVQVSPEQAAQLRRVVRALRAGDDDAAIVRWSAAVASMVRDGGPIDLEALVQWVLRESYLQANADLRDYADKVKYFNEQKKHTREAITDARRFRRRLASDEEVEAVDRQLECWERLLEELGESETLAQLDLQSVLQRQQQTLQALSNIAKRLHDTAKSIIQKLRA